MTPLWLDLRDALRTMAKAPGLTAVWLITLALGIGATTTISSAAHSVLLRPLPYAEPDRLASLSTRIPVRRATEVQPTVALRAE